MSRIQSQKRREDLENDLKVILERNRQFAAKLAQPQFFIPQQQVSRTWDNRSANIGTTPGLER